MVGRADTEAARTIAERGVQLIATVHAHSIGNVIDNPMLTELVGGCHSVVLGDDEAKKRNGSKTIVERKHMPTFDVCVEIVDFNTIVVYTDVENAVDSFLSGKQMSHEVRRSVEDGVEIERNICFGG